MKETICWRIDWEDNSYSLKLALNKIEKFWIGNKFAHIFSSGTSIKLMQGVLKDS